MRNQSAFPWTVDDGETVKGEKGMTLRDYFAAQAMQAILAHPDSDGDKPPMVFAHAAYTMADAMMKAREQ